MTYQSIYLYYKQYLENKADFRCYIMKYNKYVH